MSVAVVRPPCSREVLFKEHDSLTVDQECRWIGGFRWRVPPEAILIRELVTRVEQQLEVSWQFLVGKVSPAKL
jgi:hypothetical protein